MTEVPEKVREAYRELPSGWKLEKLKFFANIRNSNVDKTISENEEPVRLCNYTDVYYNDRITPDLHFMDGSAFSPSKAAMRTWLCGRREGSTNSCPFNTLSNPLAAWANAINPWVLPPP